MLVADSGRSAGAGQGSPWIALEPLEPALEPLLVAEEHEERIVARERAFLLLSVDSSIAWATTLRRSG